MKIRDLIAELIKLDMDADVINEGWYDLTKVTTRTILSDPHVLLVFSEDD